MTPRFNAREISAKYDRFAPWYDWLEGLLNVLGLSTLRRALFRQASGNVIEVAVGTGKNLAYYRSNCRIVASDISSEMLKVARRRAEKLSMPVSFVLADAEALPFRNQSFDTVVSSLSTCTFPNPVTALAEMARACRPQEKKSFCWSMAEAIANALAAGRIVMPIGL